jgi:hypothetical protein
MLDSARSLNLLLQDLLYDDFFLVSWKYFFYKSNLLIKEKGVRVNKTSKVLGTRLQGGTSRTELYLPSVVCVLKKLLNACRERDSKIIILVRTRSDIYFFMKRIPETTLAVA